MARSYDTHALASIQALSRITEAMDVLNDGHICADQFADIVADILLQYSTTVLSSSEAPTMVQ